MRSYKCNFGISRKYEVKRITTSVIINSISTDLHILWAVQDAVIEVINRVQLKSLNFILRIYYKVLYACTNRQREYTLHRVYTVHIVTHNRPREYLYIVTHNNNFL